MIETLLKNINKIIPLINLIIIFSFLITDYKKQISLKKFYDMSVLNKKRIDYIIIFFFLCLIYNYLNSYFSPYFITDLFEHAWINTALAFSKGINPLNIQNASEYANLYSTVWPLIVSKFSFLIELKNTSLKNLMHSINLIVFIVFCIIITHFIKKKNKVNIFILLASFYLIFTQESNLGSSPHTIGMVLYILSIFIAYFKKGNSFLLISLIFITIATLFKQYFFLGIFLIIIPQLENLDRKKIIIFFVWIIFSLSVFLTLNINYEMYFDIHYNYYLSYSKFVEFKFYRIFNEAGYLLKYFPFLLILFFYSVINYDFKNKFKKKFFITSVLVVTFIVFKMWTNIGNFAIYSLQLILPIILIYIVEYINNKKEKNNFLRLINIFIIVTILINIHGDFGYIDKKKIKKNKNLFLDIVKIVEEKNKDNLFLDKGLTLFNDEVKVTHYDAGHKLLIESYINARKNGFLKRSNFEELFLRKMQKNLSNKSEEFKKEIFKGELTNIKAYNFAICTGCVELLNSYKVNQIGKLYIKGKNPVDVKILIKKDIF
tara:strand:+ start:624 stop:2258 length:1635 start_codon:yes stop_codon:yes gene_type:complete